MIEFRFEWDVKFPQKDQKALKASMRESSIQGQLHVDRADFKIDKVESEVPRCSIIGRKELFLGDKITKEK